MRSRAFLLLVLLCPVLQSQDNARLAPPKLGYLLDARLQRIRQLLGFPGAAVVGPTIDLGAPIESAALPPSGEWLLFSQGDSHELRMFRSASDGFSVHSIEAASLRPDKIVLSPLGSAAVLYQRGASMIEVLAGLPDAAVLRRRIDASQWGEPPAHLAVSDDGHIVLVGLAGSNGLYIIGETAQVIPVEAPVTATAFAPGGGDAIVVIGARAFRLRSPLSAPTLESVTAPDDAGIPPVAAALTRDASRAILAYPNGTIRIVSLNASGSTQEISCHCVPSGLSPLPGDLLFRLNETTDPTVRLLDATRSEPRLWFVPFDRGEEQ